MAGAGYGTKSGGVPAIKGEREAGPKSGARVAAGAVANEARQAAAENRALNKVEYGTAGKSATFASRRAEADTERSKARAAIRELRAARAEEAAAKAANEPNYRRAMEARSRGSYGGTTEAAWAETSKRAADARARVKTAENALKTSRERSRFAVNSLRQAKGQLPAKAKATALTQQAEVAASRPALKPSRVLASTASVPAPSSPLATNPRTAKVKLEKGGLAGFGLTRDGTSYDVVGKRSGYRMTSLPSKAAGESFMRGAASGRTLRRAESLNEAFTPAGQRAMYAVRRYQSIVQAREGAKAAGTNKLVAVGQRDRNTGITPRVPSLASGGGLHVVRGADLPGSVKGHAIIEERTGRVLASGLSREGATGVVQGARSGKTTARIRAPGEGKATTWRTKRAERALSRLARIKEKQAARATTRAAA